MGAAFGAVNGAMVAYLRIPSIVVTLATMVALRDGLRWATDGAWIQNLPDDFQWLTLTQSSYPFLALAIALGLTLALAWSLRHLAAGRAIYATGSNREAARLAGFDTALVTFAVFVVAGGLTGLAAVLNSVRFNQIPSNAGLGLELKVIAAVVVGGTAITGGRGTIAGTVLGVVLLGAVGPALTFLGVSAYWERAIPGRDHPRCRRDRCDPRSAARSYRGRGRLDRIMTTARHGFRTGDIILLVVIAAEAALFAGVAPNFATTGNFFEITRLSVELGLLAIALTPVIVTGGIDLSVGAMMGLAAVVFGSASRDWGLHPFAAGLCAVAVGAAGGSLNAVLVARLGIPPLIVTLGTFSLFRGIAEGITQAAVNYSGFPSGFLFLGQGYLWGFIPAQLPVFALVFAAYAVLLHRSVIGRALYAIGFGQAGARYAGIPVARRVGLVYLLSGLNASLAAIIYVAHLGQARSDAGNGYELDAITAVVLGGTSVFGGQGTLWGTLLGLFSLAILRNGLRLAALPSELAGVLTGALLLATIAIDVYSRRASGTSRSHAGRFSATHGDFEVKNSQVAVVCATIIAAALIVASTNVWLVRSVVPATASPSRTAASAAGTPTGPAGPRRVIAMMPKAKGDPYFVSCRAGAEEAAQELGVELIWDGPTGLDAAKQNEVVENWITRKVDVIAVAVENRAGISTVLRKARERGIKVLTWDADAEPDARDFFVNQATPEGIGNTLTDEAARLLGGKGEFAIITGALSAANQNEWISFIEKRVAEKHPGLKKVTIRPSDDDRDKAFAETQTILRVHPNVKLVMAISAPAVPGAAEAVRQAGRKDVNVIGLSLPNINKPYVHDGYVQTVVLWNTRDLGYLTIHAGMQLLQGTLAAGAQTMTGGRLGSIQIRGSEIILGPPLMFTKANIDRFDF